MTTFGYAEMRDWAEQSDDPRVRSMWERLSNCRSKIAKWCQAAEYAELRTKNLAAENAALRAEVERLREERRWIPVEERLPPHANRVFCYDAKNNAFFLGQYSDGWYHASNMYGAVTHWLEPPQCR